MDLMMDKFKFAGFEPDRDLKGTISDTLDLILGSAPSDAEPVACLSQTRDGFTGFLRLVSSQGTFLAEAVGRDPVETLARLKDRIFVQIMRWRSLRTA